MCALGMLLLPSLSALFSSLDARRHCGFVHPPPPLSRHYPDIGSHTVLLLLEAGYNVVVADNLVNSWQATRFVFNISSVSQTNNSSSSLQHFTL